MLTIVNHSNQLHRSKYLLKRLWKTHAVVNEIGRLVFGPATHTRCIDFITSESNMNEETKPKKYERMTADRCMDWCLLAYATTKAQGYFVAYQWKDTVKCSELLLTAAKHAGLVKPTKPKGSVWIGTTKGFTMPTLTEAKLLFDQYNRDQDASKEKARKEAEAAAKAKAKVEKLAPAPDKHSDKAAQPTQLDRIEAKLNVLLKEWKLIS